MKIFLSRSWVIFFLLFFFLAVYASEDGFFVHRDQFYSDPKELLNLEILTNEQKIKLLNNLSLSPLSPYLIDFYKELHKSNAKQAEKIRKFKLSHKSDTRNIMLVFLYVFYNDTIVPIRIKKVFLSGWLPKINELEIQQHFGAEAFCLGNAYEKYSFFNITSKILTSTKRKPTQNFLSQAIVQKLESDYKIQWDDYCNIQHGNYNDTAINKLIEDFGRRKIDFDNIGGDTYAHLNHAHTEQAFFSYVENFLTNEEVIARADKPVAILINIVSYLPICDTGFCLRAISSLLSVEDSSFKKRLLEKLLYNPGYLERSEILKDNYELEKLENEDIYNRCCYNIAKSSSEDEQDLLYKKCEEQYNQACKEVEDKYQNKRKELEQQWQWWDKWNDIKINVLYTISNLESSLPFDVLGQNNRLYKAYN